MLYDLMGNHPGTIISYCPIMGGKAGLSGAVGVLRDVQRYMEKIKKSKNNAFYSLSYILNCANFVFLFCFYAKRPLCLIDQIGRRYRLGGLISGGWFGGSWRAGTPGVYGLSSRGSESQAWGGGPPEIPHAAGPLLILPNLYIVQYPGPPRDGGGWVSGNSITWNFEEFLIFVLGWKQKLYNNFIYKLHPVYKKIII